MNERKKHRFTLIFVPDAESEQPRTFSINKWGLAASLSAAFFGIVALVVIALMFTPARRLLPVSNPELERRYGNQIAAIEKQVVYLLEEMTVLRSYNLRLRRALGEDISPGDSSLIASSQATQSSRTNAVEPQSEQLTTKRSEQVSPDVVMRAQADISSRFAPVQQQQLSSKAILREFPLTMPIDGYVSRGFDAGQYHYGIDLVDKVSSTILAAADGNVVFAGWTYDDGLMVMIAHELGYMTVYKHNEALLKNTGTSVKRGEVVALLGNTGKTSSGPHLHFEVWKDGIPYDPANYLLMTQ